ncbi:MAG: nucleotide exchange factor GrpE [Candidatus Sungbacteria bacterium]|nr:nucleotide exchange factor GrpE [Candidatus Sungbacteria bacterium]
MTNDHDENDEEREEVVAEEEEEGIVSKRLKEELREAQRQRDDYLAGWQRAKADVINARRQEESARAEFIKMATHMVLRDFLALADSFEEALRSLPDEEKHAIMPLYEQLKTLLGQHGIKEIETKSGDQFDPSIHEALEGEGEMAVEVLQKGFMLYDKVLRPARVKVG